MAGRISEAKGAIILRLQSAIEPGSDEEKELISAQDALQVLESERVPKPV